MKVHGPLATLAALTVAACQGGSAVTPDVGADFRLQDQRLHDLAPQPDLTCTGSLPAKVPDGGLELPRPTGPYGIGTELRVLIDPARDELATSDPNDKRRIALQLFYPAEPCPGGLPAPLMTRGEGRIVSEDFGGLWPLDKPWEQLVVLHARANAPLATAGGRLPVVIFSHGMTMLRDLYVSYLEDLASWGFVVAAISHTYDSSAVEYSDGVVGLNTTYWTTNPSNPAPAEADAHIAVWVADARFVADQLTTWNASDPLSRFTGRLDLDKLGMFGHSYGGATAGEACFADPRFKAGANFDGNFFSPARATGGRAVSQPFMIQLAASNQYHDTSFDSFFGKLQIGYQVTIADSVHMDYSDYSLIVKQFASASPAMKWFGSGDYLRILAVSRAYNLAFFKKHLRGDPQPLLDGSSPSFPEATFKKKP